MELNNPLNVRNYDSKLLKGQQTSMFSIEVGFGTVAHCVRAWLFQLVDILYNHPSTLRDYLKVVVFEKDLDLYTNYICDHCALAPSSILRPSKPIQMYHLCQCLCMLNHKFVLDENTFDLGYSLAMVDGCFKRLVV